jgi:hypothetical protein
VPGGRAHDKYWQHWQKSSCAVDTLDGILDCMRRHILWVAATALTTLLTLSACTTGPHYSDLSQAATANDTWPSNLPHYAAAHLDPGSSRLVGHDGTTSIYLTASNARSDGVCLLIYPDNGDWVVGCGADELSVSGGGATYTVRSDGSPGDGTALSKNVYTTQH